MNVIFINPAKTYSLIPNVGLAYVISTAEKEHKVKLLDIGFHLRDYKEYVLDEVKKNKPDVIAFSVTSYTYGIALEIARFIKEGYDKTILFFGGIRPTLLPEETIEHPLIDAICIGEGEEAFCEYLNKLENSLEPCVDGIWYKNKKGDIIRNKLRPYIEDLDSLPFPNWDYWNIEKYIKLNPFFIDALPVVFSRGCPYLKCSFCSCPALSKAVPGKFYRIRKPEKIIEEIKLDKKKYAKYGFKNIDINDETFGFDKNQLDKFCNLFIEERLNEKFAWLCQTLPGIVTEQWASTVAKAGCAMVSLGIESENNFLRRKVYKKDISIKQIIEAVRNLKANNIMCKCSIIIGGPGETIKSIKETEMLLNRLGIDSAVFSFYQPLPKTELAKEIMGEEMRNDEILYKGTNIPRLNTPFLKKRDLNMIMLKIRIKNFFYWVYKGIKFKKLIFFVDIIKYMFSIDRSRIMPLINKLMLPNLIQNTVERYRIQDWKKKRGIFPF